MNLPGEENFPKLAEWEITVQEGKVVVYGRRFQGDKTINWNLHSSIHAA